MPVEILVNETWEVLANATATQTGSNSYQVVITGLPLTVMLTHLDGRILSIDGEESVQVLGSHLTNGTLTLQVRV